MISGLNQQRILKIQSGLKILLLLFVLKRGAILCKLQWQVILGQSLASKVVVFLACVIL
jgi:hypothetical protein